MRVKEGFDASTCSSRGRADRNPRTRKQRQRAGAEVTPPDERPPWIAALRADVGVGSAIGAVGAALVLAAARHVEVEVGTGLGGSGLQLSFMPKLTIAFLAAAGLTGGLGGGQPATFATTCSVRIRRSSPTSPTCGRPSFGSASDTRSERTC